MVLGSFLIASSCLILLPMYSSSAIRTSEADRAANWDGGGGAPPPSYASSGVSAHESIEASFSHRNTTFIFVIAVVVSLAIFIATYCIAYIIWSMMIRRGARNDRDAAHTARADAAVEPERSIGYGGLDAALVRSFPIVQYGPGIDTEEEKGKHVQSHECAVCLSEFDAGEEMKVLPVCGHGFHEACIDRWLLCRTTCPICRLSLRKHMQGGHGISR